MDVLADVLGPLEHHVLEEVGEAAAPGHLVAAADVVPEVDGHQRGRAILVEDHLEPVVEPIALEGDLGHRVWLIRVGRARDGADGREPRHRGAHA